MTPVTEQIPALISTRHDVLRRHDVTGTWLTGSWMRDSSAGRNRRLYMLTDGSYVLARCCWLVNDAGGTEGPATVELEPITERAASTIMRSLILPLSEL